MKSLSTLFALVLLPVLLPAEEPVQVSGVYPHLRMWNEHGEAGTGAVVFWQGDLWAITYAPHMPKGSTDKLYQITPDLEQIIFDGSVGGTPANRMIHRETNQLLIGPYVIDAAKNIRVIPPSRMVGRLTGNARHLSEPENKVYYATMEEGLYEVDLRSLDATCLIQDGHGYAPEEGAKSELPGYHGKGLFSGQGRVVYSNNGQSSPEARRDPTIDSGALAEWKGEGSWQLVRRNQFTEVSGPGGIRGNEKPDIDPIWSMGWDQKSLLLALLEDSHWHYYRLPKGSHSYDGAHGWNTEWPRIREIGEDALLATMHGTFWHFPSTFSRKNSAGIAPRSNYLKVIGDFCRWNDRIVFGCDDSAKAEFLNTRPFKAEQGAPLQSNSNLWFVSPEALDQLGPAIGRGSVWLREDLPKDSVSDPYLFSGYDHRQLHLSHGSDGTVEFTLEVDKTGNDNWSPLTTLPVPAGGAVSHSFAKEQPGSWIRIRAKDEVKEVTANFQYRNEDPRTRENDPLFDGIANVEEAPASTGVMRSLAYNKLGLVAGNDSNTSDFRYYEITPEMKLEPVDDLAAAKRLVKDVRQPENTIIAEESSVLLIEDGKRYRLPRNPAYSATEETASAKAGKTLLDFLAQSLTSKARISVSSTHSDFDSAHAIDGSLREDSRWIGSQGTRNWIEFEFGEEQSIHSLWIISGWKKEPQFCARDFDIQIQQGDEWITVPNGEIRGNRSIELEFRFDSPIKTTRLRLASRNEEFFRIYEVAAFDHVLEISPNDVAGFGPARICREVATERDLLNIHGTFYELPARNAQGLAKVRPVATHHLAIQDFCSHNGLLFFTGIDGSTESEHIFRSDDGHAAVWAGVIDDLWKLGKPRGIGGPWKNTRVKAEEPSDPYLMTAYDQKSFSIQSSEATTIRLEVDVDGTGLWIHYESFELESDGKISGVFPDGFSAYWVRAVSSEDTEVTVEFEYR
ncbi:MAG: discoidin domain-containing protein [Verrucomicrobiales bacterium]|nr:discoidin domain-containing protein [Verrucomicrobiales bacterium]